MVFTAPTPIQAAHLCPHSVMEKSPRRAAPPLTALWMRADHSPGHGGKAKLQKQGALPLPQVSRAYSGLTVKWRSSAFVSIHLILISQQLNPPTITILVFQVRELGLEEIKEAVSGHKQLEKEPGFESKGGLQCNSQPRDITHSLSPSHALKMLSWISPKQVEKLYVHLLSVLGGWCDVS